MSLPEPLCRSGYPWYQVEEEILNEDRLAEFQDWMYGQTMSICQGEECDVPHGSVVYPWDLQRFLDGRPIVD